MPIKIQSDLPVKEILEKENIFVMDESRASHQDIRPIQILILNLMPLKEETELQLLRSLSNTPLQVDVTFMAVQSPKKLLMTLCSHSTVINSFFTYNNTSFAQPQLYIAFYQKQCHRPKHSLYQNQYPLFQR